jgi:hypothetical protein
MNPRKQSSSLPPFFTAVMAALRLDEPQPQALGLLSDPEWRQLLAFCDLAHITLPLANQCEALAPAWVQSRLKQNLADNRAHGIKIAEAYSEIAAALADASVDHLVFKGFTQCPDFASTLDIRMQSDIDLYCPRTSISAAQEVLQKLGYTADGTLEKYPADHLPEMTRPRGWRPTGYLYDPQMPPPVDLHYCFWNEAATRVAVEDVDAFWDRRQTRKLADLSFPALSAIDSLAFNALHILRDVLRGDWVLHHVYEVACFLHKRAEDALLWQAWSKQHGQSLRSLQAISFYLARRWFGCRCSPVVEREIEQLSPPVRRWLDKFWESPLAGMFAPNKHGLWLHLALLTTNKDRVRILAEALFPFRLPRLGAAAQTSTKTRRTRRFWPSQPHIRYVLHVIFRSAFHLKMIPGTLWRGLGWWYAQRSDKAA